MLLPWPIALTLRILRAIASVLTLLLHPRLLRRLPWGYAGRRIRSDGRTAFAGACLAGSTGCLLIGIVVPDAVALAFLVAAVSLIVSLVVRDRAH